MRPDLATAPGPPRGPAIAAAHLHSDVEPSVRRMTFGLPCAAPPSPPVSDPDAVCFRHEFSVGVFGEPAPLKAVASLRVHLGAVEVDRVTLIRPGHVFLTCLPGTPLFKLAKSEILRREVGAIRKRARELAAADADLSLIASW